MLSKLAVALLMSVSAFAQDAAGVLPSGLWQNKEDGFVIRITPCGKGFCGAAAGAPADSKQKRQDDCGKTILKDFTWNAAKKQWQGQLQPPDMNRTLDANITTDTATHLTMKAHMGLLSKTMTFQPYTGKVSNDCKL